MKDIFIKVQVPDDFETGNIKAIELREAIDLGYWTQVSGEPVAWMNPSRRVAWSQNDMDSFDEEIRAKYSVPLYTAPHPLRELSNAEIKRLWEIYRASVPRYLGFARAIQAKLKETK